MRQATCQFMKWVSLMAYVFVTLANIGGLHAQQKAGNEISEISELKRKLSEAKTDTARLSIMENLAFTYEVTDIDSAFKYASDGIALAKQIKDPFWEARLRGTMSGPLRQKGLFAEAMKVLFEHRRIAEENNLPGELARSYRRLGLVYLDLENYNKALEFYLSALHTDQQLKRTGSVLVDHMGISDIYARMGKFDSALYHGKIAEEQAKGTLRFADETDVQLGDIYLELGNDSLAAHYYYKSRLGSQKTNDFRTSANASLGLSKLYSKKNRRDSSIYFARESFENAKQVLYKKGIYTAASLLATLYDSTSPADAVAYYKIANGARDSLYGTSTNKTIQDLIQAEEDRQRQLVDVKKSYTNKLRLYILSAVIVLITTLGAFLFRNNRMKQRTNIQLRRQKDDLENALSRLKMTQSQLIQSEKMASLGELTAGIAHEIQNPLNFMNNFSEVNYELIDEINEQWAIGNKQQAMEFSDELKQNLEKVIHHGKRADAIVKGMLQHSRKSSGQKEPTDINALCDEYLRLAYHACLAGRQGFRAKDNSFNVTIKTDLDPDINRIKIVPQEIGRVMLNLLNNAFYAVNEKAKLQSAPGTYEPRVVLTTKKAGDKIEIIVDDNGIGIAQKNLDKIFQPFFTTKPTGHGTGLGLSLAYDIITKGHGGELRVETKENDGSQFIIMLPLQDNN